VAIGLKDYTIDRNKNITRFVMITEDKIKELKFEEALKKLEELVNQLDNGDLSLEESISYYETGIKLKSHCEKLLKTAELKILKVSDKEKLVTEDLKAVDNE
jgi:exodeoxyribonuclease VII small subunit